MKRGAFGTRWGFYFAAIGSAFGLGSLWRFPYVVAENGGGAFVLLYIVLLLLLGLPLLISELLLGKFSRRSSISAFRQLVAQKASERESSWLLKFAPQVAMISIISCVFILSYYAVISGWVLHFFFQFLAEPFRDSPEMTTSAMQSLSEKGWLQVLLASVHMLAVMFVVAKGVEDGIEKAVGYIIPIFIIIVVVLMYQALQLDSRTEALRFFLYPDFSKLNINSLGAAIGHLCFTLSIGIGTMITFGSYLRDDTKVANTGFRVATLDSMSAIMAGLLVFPLLVGSPILGAPGPELMFRTVPEFILSMKGGAVFGFFFFLCLYLAALGASISILETIVANLVDSYRLPRQKAAWLSGAVVFALSLVPALSSTWFDGFSIGGRSLLEFFDWGLINWLVPISALLVSQVVVYKLNENIKRPEFVADREATANDLYFHWSIFLKWVVPPVIILGLLLQVIGLFL